MSPLMIAVMASVGIGFLLIAGAFVSFSYNLPQKLTWSLFAAAVLFVTVVPVLVAVFVAAQGS